VAGRFIGAAMQDIALTVLAVTGLLAIVSFLPAAARRLNLPFSVLLAATGCILGAVVAGVSTAHPIGMLGDFITALGGIELSPGLFLYIFLPTLLFESALAIDVRRLFDDFAPILLLAVVAVIVSTLVVGFMLAPVSNVGLIACLLLGAIVATTDPVAVVGIFRDIGAPRRLSVLVEGESLFNDAAAIALFALLVSMLTGEREADLLGTTLAFLKGFLGGAVLGLVMARVACAALGLLRGLRFAEITLTVALAYLVFVIGEHYLHVSGVVGVVTAGLVMGSYGRVRVTPTTWDHLVDTWEQLGFWASSLIFIFAAMLAPRLLADITVQDVALLALLIVGATLARTMVIFGLLPLLTMAKLSEQVSMRYSAVILWGGLRGAISLALALAVNEAPQLSPDVRHFVGVLTTGFVLFTIFVNGTTLRPLLRLLGLDRLTPAEQVLRNRALLVSLEVIKEGIEGAAASDGISDKSARTITENYSRRIERTGERLRSEADLSPVQLLDIGCIALAQREQRLVMKRFRQRTISRQIIQRMVARAGWLIDGAKTSGAAGYEAASAKARRYTWGLRTALWLHQRTGYDRFLAYALSHRFEALLVSNMVVRQLAVFIRRQLAPLLGEEVAKELAAIIDRRLKAIEQALDALKLQYPEYAQALERRYLERVAAQLESDEFDAMLSQSLISGEVHTDLRRRIGERWRGIDQSPRLDIELKSEQLIGRVPLFAQFEPSRRAELARLLRPRFVVPGTRIVGKDERGDAMYFIASGAVEAMVQPEPARLGSGEFFGEIALLHNLPRTADVVAIGYCRLLVLQARDFRRIVDADPRLRAAIDDVARQRLGVAASAAQPV
jgi:monovalent cation:H+ antiporter, CPA1 family